MSDGLLSSNEWDFDDQPKLRRIVEHLFQRGLKTCVDATDSPFASTTMQEPCEWWGLNSDRIRGWVSRQAFELNEVLHRGELNAIIELLKGFAFEHKNTTVHPDRLWSVAEDDPVLRAVILFMEPRPYWCGLMSSLLDELRKTNLAAESQGSKRLRLPATANLLSASLRKLTPLIEQSGLSYEWRRTGQGAIASLTRLANLYDDDAASSGSSCDASTDRTRQDAGKPHLDDDDDDRRICERINQQNPIGACE